MTVPTTPILTSTRNGVPRREFAPGQSAVLTCTSNGATNFRFYKGDVLLQDSEVSTYVIQSYNAKQNDSDEGMYVCEARNGDVSATSFSDSITITTGL